MGGRSSVRRSSVGRSRKLEANSVVVMAPRREVAKKSRWRVVVDSLITCWAWVRDGGLGRRGARWMRMSWRVRIVG